MSLTSGSIFERVKPQSALDHSGRSWSAEEILRSNPDSLFVKFLKRGLRSNGFNVVGTVIYINENLEAMISSEDLAKKYLMAQEDFEKYTRLEPHCDETCIHFAMWEAVWQQLYKYMTDLRAQLFEVLHAE
jgi:hypothetical protein